MAILKRGQLHLTESVAVLFIFLVLVMFAIIFYSKYQTIALQEKQQELVAARAMDTTLRVLFMPELQCTKGDAEPEDNCFDLMKVQQASELLGKYAADYYFNVFSYSNVTVVQLTPEYKEYYLYGKPKPGFILKESTFFVVTLRDQIIGGGLPTYSYGYVKVEVYS